MDNEDLGELVAVGKNLEDAVRIAEEQIEKCGGIVEYGIMFIGGVKYESCKKN
jgi:ABC-type branched-subunit amino acid transport system substrate-binding protein